MYKKKYQLITCFPYPKNLINSPKINSFEFYIMNKNPTQNKIKMHK